jgi:uncharacterized membrane protein
MSSLTLSNLVRWLALALIVLGVSWELWLAPLRAHGSFLVLKILPLALLMPGLWQHRIRSKQILSMLILLYVTEGVVRGMTDSGWQSKLAWIELAISCAIFGLLMIEFQRRKAAHR